VTALRSLYSYSQTYGYVGANPAHVDFVDAPAVARDGKTVALSPEDCRRLLDAPSAETPAGIRDRAIFGVLAYKVSVEFQSDDIHAGGAFGASGAFQASHPQTGAPSDRVTTPSAQPALDE
jgi:hypothetical protein